jgi:hypothetical protein
LGEGYRESERWGVFWPCRCTNLSDAHLRKTELFRGIQVYRSYGTPGINDGIADYWRGHDEVQISQEFLNAGMD